MTDSQITKKFCTMRRIPIDQYKQKWNSINPQYQHSIILENIQIDSESSIIRKFLDHNFIFSSFKNSKIITSICMTCTTKDNILILINFDIINTGNLSVRITYKSENLRVDNELECFLLEMLNEDSDEADDQSESGYCR